MTEINLGIIEAGRMPTGIAQSFGEYSDLYQDFLSPCAPQMRYTTFAAYKGHLPKQSHECDAWLISGSRFSAYDNEAWITALETFLVKAHEAQIPLIGICFGHQILAQALGGRVEKSAKGWGVGLHHYEIFEARTWLTGDRPGFTIHAFHQDQVIELPANCDVLAGSQFCPHAMLEYGKRAISIQGHPEFGTELAQRLINLRRGKSLPVAVADKALEGIGLADTPETIRDLNAPPECLTVATWITNFLNETLHKV